MSLLRRVLFGGVALTVAGTAAGQKVPDFETPILFDMHEIGNPYGIDAADILDATGQPGQDGLPEIVVAGAGVDFFDQCELPPAPHLVRVFHNTGTWDFDPANALSLHQSWLIESHSQGIDYTAMEIAFADVTGGGEGPDLVLTAYDADNGLGFLIVYRNLGNGQYDTNPFVTPTPGVTLRGLVTADFDLDGDVDAAAAAGGCNLTSSPQNRVVIFENDTQPFGDPTFVAHVQTLSIVGDTAPGAIIAEDFYAMAPGQPLLDLVTINEDAPSVTKLANVGSLQFDDTTESSPCAGWAFVTAVAGRFGSDAHADFAAVLPEDLFAGVFRGQGLGSFESYCDDPDLGYYLFTPSPGDEQKFHAHGIDKGHLNGGSHPDLAVALRQDDIQAGDPDWNGAVALLLGKSDGTFKTFSPSQAFLFPLDAAGAALVKIVDLDNDGFDDLVVTNHQSDNISVLINKFELTIIGP